MPVQQGCTVVGYDADTGEKLFTMENVAQRDHTGLCVLPRPFQSLERNGKNYHVVLVRPFSRENLWEVEVREEPRAKGQ